MRAAALALAAASLAAACVATPAPGPAPVRVTALEPDRAVVLAGGRRVVIAPPDGACLSEDHAQAAGGAAFFVITDCDGGPGPLRTVSVSGSGLFTGDEASALFALERFARTPQGRRELGMGGGPEDVSILETRRADDALFVHVEDRGDRRVPIAGPRFWRVFCELNGRLAVISLSGTDSGTGPEAALSAAREIVAALRAANDESSSRAEPRPRPVAPGGSRARG